METDKTTSPKKTALNLPKFAAKIGIFLLIILLPALIISGLLYWFASAFNLWQVNQTLVLGVFVVLLVILSFIIVFSLSALYSRDGSKAGFQLRLLVMVMGELVVPILLFSGANLINIAPGETYMARLIQLSIPKPANIVSTPLSAAIINSKSALTKVEGIKAINSSHTSADMEQLFVILNNDSASLTNQLVSDALSKAIASYGVDAKRELLAVFQKHANSGQTAAAGLPDNLYDAYFAQPIEGLQAEINAQPQDDQTKQGQLQQVDTIANQIKSALNDFQSDSSQSTRIDPVLSLVLDTSLQMTLTSDTDFYSFAKTTAADTTLPDTVRAKALLLLAKLGGKDDIPQLYTYLSNNSEVIKANAFTAIASLNQKLSSPAKTK